MPIVRESWDFEIVEGLGVDVVEVEQAHRPQTIPKEPFARLQVEQAQEQVVGVEEWAL